MPDQTFPDRPAPMESPFPPPAPAGDLVAGLVPALVHRLNNAFAVLSGALDPDADPEERVRAKDELARASRALSYLSRLSKPPVRGPREEFDLRSALDALELLVAPLAATRRLGLEVANAPAPLPALVDGPRLVRFLIEFVAAEAIAAVDAVEGARAGEDGPRRQRALRIGGSIRPGHATLTVTRPVRGAARPPHVLERERAFLVEQGVEVLLRRIGGAVSYRFRVASPALEAVQTESLHRAAARLLVVESDPVLRELVQEVLVEAGHELLAVEPGAPETVLAALAAGPDLALVDADLEELLASLSRQPTHAPVLLLGRPRAPLPASFPSLAKPFRPGDLLRAVDASLAPSTVSTGA